MKKWMMLTATFALSFSLQGFASDDEKLEEDLHAVVEERPISEEKEQDIANQQREEYECVNACDCPDECDENSSKFGPSEKVSRNIWLQEVYYPDCYHWIVEPSILGDIVILEDGSQWTVRPSDRKKLSHWILSDPIMVTQNTSWFSKYKYKFVNKTTDSNIEVNMTLGPVHDGEFTHWITGIDTSRGQILLEDGSYWDISSSDYHIFRDWLLNDTIVIGANSSWFSQYEFILIDVETYTFVRANQLN